MILENNTGQQSFFNSEKQKKEIEESIIELQKSGKYKKKIVTEILPVQTFWKAEEYHQDYLTKNPGGYCHVNLNNVNV